MEAAYHAALQNAERMQVERRGASALPTAPQCFDLSPKGEAMEADVPPVSFDPQPPLYASGMPLGATPWGGNVAGLGLSFPGFGTSFPTGSGGEFNTPPPTQLARTATVTNARVTVS